MSELEVRSGTALIVLARQERLAFGRSSTDASTPRGWGYDGRFLELSPSSHVHRIWGELVCDGSLWRVRSLGQLHPIVVVPGGGRSIELGPLRSGQEPRSYAATDDEFDVELSVGVESFRLSCRVRVTDVRLEPSVPAAGSDTITLCLEMADCVTATEYPIVWEMAREYRSDPPVPDPHPLTYARVMRSLGLREKQVVSAVARVVGRFRSRDLMPASLPPGEQRAWLCRQLVAHRVFDELARRHGEA